MSVIKKANPYVYPTDDFAYLSKSKGIPCFTVKTLDLQEMLELLQKHVEKPQLSIKSKNTFEKFVEIMTAPKNCYGDKELILSELPFWKEKFEKAQKNNKLSLTIFGFPFKIPVSLKSDRINPDAGEIAVLMRLKWLASGLEKTLNLKTTVTIFAEDGFAKFIKLDQSFATKYFKALTKIVSDPWFEGRIRLVKLSDMEKHPQYQKTFDKNLAENLQKYHDQDSEYLTKYAGTAPVVFRIINTRQFPEALMPEVYADNQKVSPAAQNVRDYINETLPQSVAEYFAYLKTRDDLQFIEAHVANPMFMSVSPKKRRLGIFPLSKKISKLPYHAVPYISKQADGFDLAYLHDLCVIHDAEVVTAYKLQGDTDKNGYVLYGM